MKIKQDGYVINVLQVSDRWIFIVETDDKRQSSYISDDLYDSEQHASEAGIEYVKKIYSGFSNT